MSTALATAPNNALSNGAHLTVEVDQSAILTALGLNPKNPKAQALVLTCARYGLDPILKHAVLIGSGENSNLYVTRDGLMHVAHSSGKFDGMEVETLPETQTHFVARATVWRKDMARPFTMQGRYPKSGQMAKYGPEMAEKVAVCRTLRHAFSVSLCSREETWEEESEAALMPAATIASPASNAVPSASSSLPNLPKNSAATGPLYRAQAAFADEARHLNLDIDDSQTLKPSKSKMFALATDVARHLGWNPAAAFEDYRVADWQDMKKALADFARTRTEEQEQPDPTDPAQDSHPPLSAAVSANDDDEDDGLGDPFAATVPTPDKPKSAIEGGL